MKPFLILTATTFCVEPLYFGVSAVRTLNQHIFTMVYSDLTLFRGTLSNEKRIFAIHDYIQVNLHYVEWQCRCHLLGSTSSNKKRTILYSYYLLHSCYMFRRYYLAIFRELMCKRVRLKYRILYLLVLHKFLAVTIHRINKRQAMYRHVQRNNMARSRKKFCRGKVLNMMSVYLHCYISYSACNAHAPYYVICGLSRSTIFFHFIS